MNENSAIHSGSCLCGGVRYDVTGPLREVISCHCTQCQKSSGHYFAATAAALTDFHLREGRSLKWYRSSDWAERGFCADCGSNLFWRMKDRDAISILAGSLDGDTGLKTICHLFVADKKDYYEITDGLPQYEGYPKEMENG